jgi:hypothetical protein
LIHVKKQFELPVCSTEFIKAPDVCLLGKVVEIRLAYFLGETAKCTSIRFFEVMAIRITRETACTSFHVRAFDKILLVIESDWVTQVFNQLPPRHRGEFVQRHFAIFLEGMGCAELLSKDFEVVEVDA